MSGNNKLFLFEDRFKREFRVYTIYDEKHDNDNSLCGCH